MRLISTVLLALSVAVLPGIARAADATDSLSCVALGGYCLSNTVQTVCPTGETYGGKCGVPLCCIKPTAAPTKAKDVKPYSAKSSVVPNPLGANADILTILSRVVTAFIGVVGAISLLVFFYAGVRYMTAAGEEKAITQAKDTMKYAFIGLFFIIFAYVIANFFFQALVRGPGAFEAAPPTPTTLPTI